MGAASKHSPWRSHQWQLIHTLGAHTGMMAIPKAFYMMGSLLGSTMLVAVAALTYWTKAVMVEVRGSRHRVMCD